MPEAFCTSFIAAEIESALNQCFADKESELSMSAIIKNLKDTVPLSITQREKVDANRKWAQTRARFASKQEIRQRVREVEIE